MRRTIAKRCRHREVQRLVCDTVVPARIVLAQVVCGVARRSSTLSRDVLALLCTGPRSNGRTLVDIPGPSWGSLLGRWCGQCRELLHEREVLTPRAHPRLLPE